MYFPAFHYGIYAIDPVTFEFKLYASVFDKLRSNFLPICMIEASDGKFWIGTSTEGLVTYDPSTSSWNHVEEVDCESINTIVEYPDGHLWIGTVDGFYTYDIKTNYAVHYTQNERITIGEISRHSTVVMENGGILFGGREGVFFFNTNNSTNQQKIDLYFDDIYINGNRVAPSEKECIDKEMRFSPDVTLKKDIGSISFTFSTPSISSDMVEYWSKDLTTIGRNRCPKILFSTLIFLRATSS